ncbi:MAG: PKD domain-containing protein [Saprospirales bacterium]|nr:PKD domain-containing protein [Saprospirales bacterium]
MRDFTGGMPATSDEFFPAGIVYNGRGTYTVSVTVTNGCGTDTDQESFDLLDGPELDIALSADFACIGEQLSVTNNSTGDQLSYQWTVSPAGGVTFDNATSPTPSITVNGPIGLYTITVEVGNPVCDPVTQSFEVLVSQPPTVDLSPIGDDCETTVLTPVVVYTPVGYIDEVMWDFTGGTPATSDEFFPSGIMYNGANTYTVSVTVTNGCGTDTDQESFDLLDGPELDIALSADFACIGEQLSVTNNSTGDQLSYQWTVSPAGGVTFSDAASPMPVITVNGPIGLYTITVEVGNPVCDPVTQSFEVLVSQPPTVDLSPIGDDCETTVLTPVVAYTPTGYIDEVMWDFTGGMPATSDEFFPAGIVYNGAGTYTVSVTVTNGCGTDTDQESFDLLDGPELAITLEDFVCEGNCLTPENNSTGDQLIYEWTVTPPGEVAIDDAASATPQICFEDTPIGTYTITVVVSNPVCDPVTQSFEVLVSDQPTVTLDAIPDFCAGASFTPSAIFSDTNFIDSVFWSFPGSDLTSSTEFFPGEISYGNTGTYQVSVSVFNACGTATDSQFFDILEPMTALAALDTTFGCLPDFTVGVENQSTGDELNYEWTVSLPDGTIISQEEVFEPLFSFPDTGLFIIKLRVYNDVCGEDTWMDSVLVQQAPVVDLAAIDDFCELATIMPIVSYNSDTTRIDSVAWFFPGGDPASSNLFFPTGIVYDNGAGDYTITVSVFNACGMDMASQTFTIDTIPMVDLGPPDTVCITDGVFQLQQAIPPGGIWTGPPGSIVDPELSLVDPTPFPGGQTITVTYTFTEGECEISTDKDILIIDLSYVDAGPDIGFCVSDSCSVLTGGTPAGGWYVGPGVIDSTGIFCPGDIGSLADVTVTITYFYQLPGTDCIGSDEFDVTVYALPVSAIGGVDSICVDVPAQMVNNSLDGASFLWIFCDGTTSTQPNPVHTFMDTGYCEVKLIVTSAEGCVDSTTAQVYVSGPPVAAFSMDTTSGCPILPVTFTNESIGFEYVQYFWDFQVSTSTEVQPGTILFDQGTMDTTYYITLTATNHCGTDIYLDSVIVFSAPQPNFVANQYVGCSPLEVAFNNLSLGQPDSVYWDMGNGIFSSDWIPPDQVYLAPDSFNVVYTVTLYGFNEFGMDSISQEITVKPNIIRAFFTPSVNEGCEPLEVSFLNTSTPIH